MPDGFRREAARGGDNDTPVQSQFRALKRILRVREPSQAMRAADRDPAGGEIPVELAAASRLTISFGRGVEDKQAISRNTGNLRINCRKNVENRMERSAVD